MSICLYAVSSRRLKIIAKLLLVAGLTGVASADSVVSMCKNTDDVCKCASARLKADAGDETYALYEAIGAAFLTNRSGGMGMGDAWDAAVKAESTKRAASFVETMQQTNAIGQAHRKAIKCCAG